MLRYAFLAGYSLLLAYGLFKSGPPPEVFPQSDKFLHLGAFGMFTLLVLWALQRVPRKLLIALLLACAPLSELMQALLHPHSRTYSWHDVAANLCGVLLGILAWRLLNKLARTSQWRPV